MIDLAILSLAFWAAFFLRFEGYPPFQEMKRLVFLWPYVMVVQYACLAALGVPSFAWRYIGLREVTRIFLALVIASGFAVIARLVSGDIAARVFPHAEYFLIPFGVILIDFSLAFLGITGVRVVRRLLAERTANQQRGPTPEPRRILLIGAGQAGLMVAKELAQRPDLGLKPVAFVDDAPTKRGLVVHGIPVLGTTAEIPEIAARKNVKDALITIAQAPGRDIRRIRDLCVDHGLTTKIIPGIYEIVGGHVNLSRIREVGIEDLLGREPVELDASAVSEELRGRVVMVTGAGGSIGSELCRQVLPFSPARLVLVERAENALFDIHRELARSGSIDVAPCVADVGDRDRMQALFVQHRPDVVFHAAAHKHVPMMEWNPGEAVKNNVLGTVTLADLAVDHGVDAFVMISTDKAVNPTSVMGVSKRTAELYAQSLAQRAKTRFVTVRFGNVLGSAGSVIPIFKEQISRGGPVTVTHPDMQRYFMTIPEACQLVLQAGTMGGGGEIFVLDMGEPVKILDLARDLIELSGFAPDEEIAIEFSGVRPGEKLFEELSVSEENADKTRHPKIFIGRGKPPEASAIHATIARLRELADAGDAAGIRAAFAALVPEYTPSGDGMTARPAPPAVVALDVEAEPSRRALATAPS